MKAFNKAAILILLLLWSASSVSLCPEKGTSFLKFKDLTSSSINSAISQGFNLYYELVNQANDAILKRHKVISQAGLTVDLELENIEFTVPKDSEIVASSNSANCVAIFAGGKITTYQTSTGQFVSSQQFADATYSKNNIFYSLADDCSLVGRIQFDNKGAIQLKWYNGSVQTTSVTFPLEAAGDQNIRYVVDTQRNLFTLQQNGVYLKKSYPQLKIEPVQVKWSDALQAVITVTKHTDIHSIVIIDPKLDSVLYNVSFSVGLNYTDTLNLLIKDEQVSILLTDKNGFVSFIQLQRQKNTIKETVYTLGSSDLSVLFAPTSFISVSNKIIFIYANKKMSYLEAADGSIKLLNAFDTDIEYNSFKQRTQTLNTQEPRAILSLVAPNQLNLCNIAGSDVILVDFISTSSLTTPAIIDVKTGAITKCPKNCLTCQSPTKCTTCLSGYALLKTQSKCVPCKGCLSCSESDPKVCYSCFAPQYLDKTTNACVSPTCNVDNCLQCNSTGACSICLKGYGLIGGKCVKCQVKGCKSCSTNAKTCDANSCKLGFVYYVNPKTQIASCQLCTAGINNCPTTDLSSAAQCAKGSYILKDKNELNRCAKCLTNCSQCNDGVSCAKCINGYLPSTDGKKCVLRCSDNCLTCDSNNATKCLSCFTGSQLNTTTNKCVSDLTCNQTSTCTFCNDGFVLNNGQCLQCKYTDTNCDSCLTSDQTVCDSCKVGFYLSNNTCKACQTGCGNCVGASSCVTCNDGFYIVLYQNKDIGTCFACDSSCKTCFGLPTICTSCDENSTLQGSKCISKKNVAVQFVIQANVNNFVQFMNQMQDWFLNVSNSGKQQSAPSIQDNKVAILKTQKYGSSVVNGQVSAESNSNANAICHKFNAVIGQTPSIGGYQIISGFAIVQTDAPDPVPPEEKSKLGLILGLSIPLGLLALIGIIIILFKINQRRNMSKNDQKYDNRDTADHIGRSNERIDSRF